MSDLLALPSRSGAWLLDTAAEEAIFTPEQLSEEHRLVAATARELVQKEVLPALDRLEQKDWSLNRELVSHCGELGLLGTDVAEDYGGVELDKVASMVVSEQIGWCAAFSTTFGAQTNLMIAPLSMFGTEAQKAAYLPRLVSGELIGAYCLSESASGSDALSARCRATAQPDGSYVLSGEKMWITCGGFADLFLVFAKVDGTAFTAFLVERTSAGVSSGREEHKMGLHGSSTTSVLLRDVVVSADAVLGQVGKGHKVAFNVLNLGRLKLGAMCSGGAQAAIGEAAHYAGSRKQFGQPLADFGAVKHKLGEMTAREYALQSVMYRTAGLLDQQLAASGDQSLLAALEALATEASIAKVLGSEVLDFIVDENVQVHGGNGYVKDYPAEGRYRDARVNRIFEGTNEINRLLIPGLLLKRQPQAGRAHADDRNARAGSDARAEIEPAMAGAPRGVHGLKRATLATLAAMIGRYGEALTNEQEVVSALADLVIESYAADSAVRRASQALQAGGVDAALHADAASVYLERALGVARGAARLAWSTLDEDAGRSGLSEVETLLGVPPANTVAMRRRLSDATVARGGYLFT